MSGVDEYSPRTPRIGARVSPTVAAWALRVRRPELATSGKSRRSSGRRDVPIIAATLVVDPADELLAPEVEAAGCDAS